MKETIAFIGFMGAGKTSVAAELCERLGVGMIDIDAEVEASTGMSIAEIFARHGERYFRGLEHELLQDALTNDQPALVSCGGGIVLDPHNAALLKKRALVIYLQVSAQEILRRIDDASTRPLLMAIDEPDELAAMIAARELLYEAAADISIDTDGKSVVDVCDEIATLLEEGDHGLFHA
jgi:shikimate kinase